MNTNGLVLVIPEKGDPERDAVAEAWASRGGDVLRLGRFWDPPAVEPRSVRLYGNDSFCLVLAQKLGLTLVSPDDDAMLAFPREQLGRRIARQSLCEALAGRFPTFAKPETPKLFRAGVYTSPSALALECNGLAPATSVLISDVVSFTAEARAFVLDGRVLDCALYEGDGERASARSAAETAIRRLPPASTARTYVLDLGRLDDVGWVVVELNASWGAGLNGCDARSVLPAIEAATKA